MSIPGRMVEWTQNWTELTRLDLEHENILRGAISRIAKGDEQALSDLYDMTRRNVYGLALRILRQSDAAEDVITSVYTQVWRNAGSFDSGRGSVGNWLLTITRSRSLDLIRKRQRRSDREAPIDDWSTVVAQTPDPERRSLDMDLRSRIGRALGELPVTQRQVICAAYFEGLSQREMADAFDVPLGTVKTRIRLGLKALRMSLATQGGVS